MSARTSVSLPTRVPDIRKGDTVIVLGGKDAGKRGVVDRVMRRRSTTYGRHRLPRPDAPSLSQAHVVVQGINIAKRHTKPRQQSTQNQVAGVPQIQPGGILDIAQPLPLSRVMVVCPRCDKPTRVRHELMSSGQRVRVCRNCGEPLEAVS
jgi:large subunit ribosomal protein L24